MRHKFKTVMQLFLCLLLFATLNIVSAETVLYPGAPEVSKLSPSVKANTLFVQAPTRTVKQTNLFSHVAGTNQYYSHYQMNPVVTQGFITKYYTNEYVKNGSGFLGTGNNAPIVVHGFGISYGGIFWPLEMMQAKDSQGNLVYYNKIDINSMKYVSGNLFPLQVGNDLKFYFTRSHERMINGKTTLINDQGIMEFKVVNKFQGFSDSIDAVPGDIYTIEVWESTNIHPKKYLTDIFDYSNTFGWYIRDSYYDKSNRLLITYRLHEWK